MPWLYDSNWRCDAVLQLGRFFFVQLNFRVFGGFARITGGSRKETGLNAAPSLTCSIEGRYRHVRPFSVKGGSSAKRPCCNYGQSTITFVNERSISDVRYGVVEWSAGSSGKRKQRRVHGRL
jgi:hypothetical protein